MTIISRIGTISGTATGVGASLLTSLLEHAGQSGVRFAIETLDKAALERTFSEKLNALPQGRGELYGFMRFRAPDGSIIKHGPISLGDGKRPADPLVSLGYSNRAAKRMGEDPVSRLNAPAGTEWDGIDYYWAIRTAEGVELFRVDDAASLQAEAIGTIYRQKALAILASKGDTLTRLTRQAKLFDVLEEQMRDELRRSGIEARLASIRQAMRRADALFRRASADREAALRRADKAKGLQQVSQILGLVANFASFVDVANAQANYAASEQANAANGYNINVINYIEVIQQNTTVSPQALPSQPKITVPPGN